MCTNLRRTLLLFPCLLVMALAGSVAAQQPPQGDAEPGVQQARQIRAAAEQARHRTRAETAQRAARENAQRLTQLEQKLDTLLREVRQLRQEIQRIRPIAPVRPFQPPRVGPRDMQRGPDQRGPDQRGAEDRRPDAPRDMRRDSDRRDPEPRRGEERRGDAQPRGPQRDAPRDMQRDSDRREATPRGAEERRGDRPDRPQPERKKAAVQRDGTAKKIESKGDTDEGDEGTEIDARYVRYAVMMVKKYDVNQNGVLERDEWSKMPQDKSAADTDKDGRITPLELGRSYQYPERREPVEPQRAASTEIPPQYVRFAEKVIQMYDANKDGVLTKDEWREMPKDYKYDANKDGVLSEDERRELPRDSSAADTDKDGRITPVELGRFYQRSTQSAPVEPRREASKEIDPKYVKYAVGVIKKYDSNRDGVLTKDEWSKMARDSSAADANKDGRITPVELGRFYQEGK